MRGTTVEIKRKEELNGAAAGCSILHTDVHRNLVSWSCGIKNKQKINKKRMSTISNEAVKVKTKQINKSYPDHKAVKS